MQPANIKEAVMKRRVKFTGSLVGAALVLTGFFSSPQSVYAGDSEWATVGKILTGVVGAGIVYEVTRNHDSYYYPRSTSTYYRSESYYYPGTRTGYYRYTHSYGTPDVNIYVVYPDDYTDYRSCRRASRRHYRRHHRSRHRNNCRCRDYYDTCGRY